MAEYLTDEYLIQEETLAGLAGSLRTLNGSTDSINTPKMRTIIDEANTEIGSQASVIDEIKSALSGKALEPGDEEIVEEIQSELDRRNFVAYDTCTVTVTDNTGYGTQSHMACWYLGIDTYGNVRNLTNYGGNMEGDFSISFVVLKGSRIFIEHNAESYWLDSVSASDGATVSTMDSNQNVFVITLGTDITDDVTIDCSYTGGW